ncbi:MAG: transposase [Planctomycetes bacterium]|nr:transposase [Planctomycetota bacterium]
MRRRGHRQLITKRLWRKWLVPYIATLSPARQKFVQQAVHGILACGVLILSQMARSLRETSTRFLYVLKRFSRHLGHKGWDRSVLHAEVLERNAAWVYQDTPVMIDLSESAKPHARRLYLRRWRAEDGIRFLKTGLGLERVRVMNWRRLRHMMALALLAMTVLALALEQPHRWRTQLIARGKSRKVPAQFPFYRILKGIAHLLRHHPLL